LAGYDNALVISLSRRLVLLQALRAWTEAELATHGIIDQAEFEAVAGGLFETSTGNHAIWLVPNGIQSYVFPPNEPGAGVDLLHTDPPEKALDSLAALNTHELVVSLPEATTGGLELRSRLAIYSQSHFWSLVTIAIDLPAVFADAGLDAAAATSQLVLKDFFNQVIYRDPSVFQHDPVVQQVAFPGGSWQLAIVPEGGWIAPIQDVLTLVRIFGMLAVALISILIYLAMGRQTRLELAERKPVEMAVREREEKYRTVVETSTDPILLQTPTGQIVDCNSAAVRLFNYPRDSLCKMTMADLAPENVAGLLPVKITPELTTGGDFIETFYVRNGSPGTARGGSPGTARGGSPGTARGGSPGTARGLRHLFAAEVRSQMISMGSETFVLSYIRDISQRK